MNSFKRKLTCPLAACIGAALITGGITTAVYARSVNIQGRTIQVIESATGFTVTGKVTGLAGGFQYEVEAFGDVDVSQQCINPGGHDPKPHGSDLTVSASGTFTSDKNGNVTFSVTQPIAPIDCPGENWDVEVTYSGTIGVQICDDPCDNQAAALATAVNIDVEFP